jgi:peptidoglycan/xylan/chitin deacetylase (PgdA/CDA1 family)
MNGFANRKTINAEQQDSLASAANLSTNKKPFSVVVILISGFILCFIAGKILLGYNDAAKYLDNNSTGKSYNYSIFNYNKIKKIKYADELRLAQSKELAQILKQREDAEKSERDNLKESAAKDAAYKALIAPDTEPYSKGKTGTVIYKIATKKPVVFLTMDDGDVKKPEALKYILDNKLNPTLFLTDSIIKNDYDYFKAYQSAGIQIQNHTLEHPILTKLNLAQQKAEICGQRDKLKSIFQADARLFRPPYGEFNAITKDASFACGAPFLIHWSAKVNNGVVEYQQGNKLLPGDIVLMHFRPRIMDDLKAFKDEVAKQGLTPALLGDWVR